MVKTIVIIDDDADDLDLMSDLIRSIDDEINCISFFYADEALKRLKKEQVLIPDLFFIDINMPRISGEEALREIRSIEEFKQTQIVMYSTVMSEAASSRLLTSGASITMQKPTSLKNYRNILRFLIKSTNSPGISVKDGRLVYPQNLDT
jgi:DNA-binding response OmpR family regulator